MKSKPAQTTLRVTLPASAERSLDKSTNARFNRFELPFTETPPSLDRRRILLANELRRAAIAAVETVTRCAPAHLGIALDAASAIEGIIQSTLEANCISQDENASCMAGNRPHTLRDCLTALESCRRLHRAPSWFQAERGALEAVSRKLDIIAGLLIRNGKDAASWSGISEDGGQR